MQRRRWRRPVPPAVLGTGAAVFGDRNAGANKPAIVSGYTLSGADAGNYNLIQSSGMAATINKASLAMSGIGAADKTYDGGTVATLTGSATVTALGSDAVTVSGAGTGAFASKNAGGGQAVTVTGFSPAGLDAGNYSLVMPAMSADITRASLAVSGVIANDKTYDGTAAATLGGSATVAAIGSDVVSLAGGVGIFADKNAGSNKAVSASGYTLGGLDAGNYTLVQPAGLHATIGKASLVVTGITASDKVYDGATAAILAGSATVAALGNDVVSVAGTGAGTFADKNAGAGKAVRVSGYTLAGLDAGNYDINVPAGLHATITPAPLIVSGIVAGDKDYDGTVAAGFVQAFGVAVNPYYRLKHVCQIDSPPGVAGRGSHCDCLSQHTGPKFFR